ncbi:ribokinase [soil metagenome]
MDSKARTQADVLVIGSLSMDIVIRVPRLPGRGETLKGSTFDTFPGGKGNNQALAAARSGAAVAMIGKVGDDAYGQILLDTLKENGVNTEGMSKDSAQTTGIANIWVGPSGENSIVIVPNANNAMTPLYVASQKALLNDAKVLLLQLEIPTETVIEAAKLARAEGLTVILNPAPAPENGLPAELLQNVDVIVPNETEAHLLTGINPTTPELAHKCALKLIEMGPKGVILTLGERGAMILESANPDKPQTVSAFKVAVVDSTAAGDAFCGTLAMRLAKGDSLVEAAKYGCAAGSLACTKAGAVPSLPGLAELENLIGCK